MSEIDLDALRFDLVNAELPTPQGSGAIWDLIEKRDLAAKVARKLLARIAELEAERDDQRERGDQYNREAQHWVGMVVDLEAAERRGYERAVARLRDEDELRRWQATALDALPAVVHAAGCRRTDGPLPRRREGEHR